jgi:hypothetical protein
MAFILIDLDSRPMRVKGASLLPGIAVPNEKNPIESGIYRAIGSEGTATILNSGGSVFPQDSARAAFAVSRPIPVSIDAAAFGVAEPLDKVFIRQDESMIVEELSFQATPLSRQLEGFWLPAAFSGEGCGLSGWVRQSSGAIAVRILHEKGSRPSDALRVTLVHEPALSFEIKL